MISESLDRLLLIMQQVPFLSLTNSIDSEGETMKLHKNTPFFSPTEPG